MNRRGRSYFSAFALFAAGGLPAFATEASAEIPAQVTSLGIAGATSFLSLPPQSNVYRHYYFLNDDPSPPSLTATTVTYASESSTDQFAFNAASDANRPRGPIQEFVATTNYNTVANGQASNTGYIIPNTNQQGTLVTPLFLPLDGPAPNIEVAPEPATWMMATAAVAGLALVRYRARPYR